MDMRVRVGSHPFFHFRTVAERLSCANAIGQRKKGDEFRRKPANTETPTRGSTP
jgi:hypothetical protein